MLPPIVLASKSVRRAEILTAIGLPYIQADSHIDEKRSDQITDPKALVLTNAKLKASAPKLVKNLSTPHSNGAFIIGVDTVVSCNGVIFEKPQNLSHAKEMFQSYLKHPSIVYTGMALYETKTQTLTSLSATATLTATKTYFKDDQAYEALFRHIVSLDKSGGFSIEGMGSVLFQQLDGSFYTVIGMPLHLLFGLFQQRNISIYAYLPKSSS